MSRSTAPWTLRRADAADAASVSACAVEAFAHYIPRLGLTPIPMTRDYAAAIAHAQVWVATQQGETIAALVLDITEEGFLIDVIAVRPQHQGTGAGRALLELAEREALRQGHDSIYLFTNEKMSENRALYERIGYVEYKRAVLAERTRVFLRKPLK
ncbi:GNAT family N-acetyltransferase [Variovorax boronicumulans]|uniref:GNAT family N-acetyltransferase n=1 Tax=Variovorax boronicumulans TaxID=436515 RepID=UPI0033967755